MARISKARQNEIRQSIVEEAKNLFFSKGFDQTSTKEISIKVGIAEGTLFNYYKEKNDLFLAALKSEFDIEINDSSFDYEDEDAATEIIHSFLSKLFRPFMSLPKSLIIEFSIAMISISKKDLAGIQKLSEIDAKYISECKKLIDELKEKGLFVSETDTQELTENILSTFLFEVIMYVYNSEMPGDEIMKRFKRKIESVCKGYLPIN